MGNFQHKASPPFAYKTVHGSTLLKKIRLCFFTLLCTALSLVNILPAQAGTQDSISREQKIKAAYIYHLTKFIDWPLTHPNKRSDAINVCVSGGDTPFTRYLQLLENRQAKGRPIAVMQLQITGDATACHLVFYPNGSKASKEQLDQLNQQGTLTVGESADFMKSDGMVGMFIIDNRVRLHFNYELAKQAGIMVSANLLEVATIFKK
jgi:hypothetical protein